MDEIADLRARLERAERERDEALGAWCAEVASLTARAEQAERDEARARGAWELLLAEAERLRAEVERARLERDEALGAWRAAESRDAGRRLGRERDEARALFDECNKHRYEMIGAALLTQRRAEQAESQLALACAWGRALVALARAAESCAESAHHAAAAAHEEIDAAEERGATWMRAAAKRSLNGTAAPWWVEATLDDSPRLDPATVCAEARAREVSDG